MRLIVNADDFGITTEVSRGILEGMRDGFITDTSALVNSPDFLSSVVLAREAGVTEMGVHLTITFLKPVLDAAQVSSIVDPQGNFYRKPQLIPSSYNKQEVRDELRTQIETFLRTGLKMNHLDTHHGFSIMDEQMLAIVIGLAQEYQVPMRRDDAMTADERLKEQIVAPGMKVADRLYFDPSSPSVREEKVRSILECWQDTEAVVEIAGHPGYADDKLRTLSSLADEREMDLKLFMNQDLLTYIKDRHIELISYSKL
ncbi:ChbG/HpnK family deacetylase [Paenibacillus jiagnxiensis]|uniref:ChbG/HpnK family deacetylase n=1 Tax=Paenibacillus jiagnxiensis TaxID=3228926 RepID=UPI0033B73F24